MKQMEIAARINLILAGSERIARKNPEFNEAEYLKTRLLLLAGRIRKEEKKKKEFLESLGGVN